MPTCRRGGVRVPGIRRRQRRRGALGSRSAAARPGHCRGGSIRGRYLCQRVSDHSPCAPCHPEVCTAAGHLCCIATLPRSTVSTQVLRTTPPSGVQRCTNLPLCVERNQDCHNQSCMQADLRVPTGVASQQNWARIGFRFGLACHLQLHVACMWIVRGFLAYHADCASSFALLFPTLSLVVQPHELAVRVPRANANTPQQSDVMTPGRGCAGDLTMCGCKKLTL